jgi:hypothetical protein
LLTFFGEAKKVSALSGAQPDLQHQQNQKRQHPMTGKIAKKAQCLHRTWHETLSFPHANHAKVQLSGRARVREQQKTLKNQCQIGL